MIAVNNEYILRKIGNEYLIVSIGKCRNGHWFYKLNETAVVIWKICRKNISYKGLIDELQVYLNHILTDTEEHQIKQYILELVQMGVLIEE